MARIGWMGAVLGASLVSGMAAGGAAHAAPCLGTFSYTGALQSCTVDVTGLYQVDAYGAQGGTNTNTGGSAGGLGAHAGGQVLLVAGDILQILEQKPSDMNRIGFPDAVEM